MILPRLLLCGVGCGLGGFYSDKWDWANKKFFSHKCQPQELNLLFDVSSKDVRMFNNLIFCFDRRTRCPRWVCEKFQSNQRFCYWCFEEEYNLDTLILPAFRTQPQDFQDGGYAPKYLALPESHCLNNDVVACFTSGNLVPIPPGFRALKPWVQAEMDLRACIEWGNCWQNPGRVFMFSGPLYLPLNSDVRDQEVTVETRVIGDRKMVVPTHYFKFIVGRCKDNPRDYWFRGFMWENTATSEAYVLNDKTYLENISGLKLLPNIEDENIRYLTPLQDHVRRSLARNH